MYAFYWLYAQRKYTKMHHRKTGLKEIVFGKFKMGRNLLSTKKTSKNNDNHNNNNNDNGNNNNNSILALLYLRTLFTQTVSTSAR